MIYTVSTVTIKDLQATIDQTIYLYRGDKNVEIQFLIAEGMYRQYKMDGANTIENLGASHGQLIVRKPDGSYVFSDVVPTKEGRIIFTIPQELIDENVEVGFYTFQIRLFDETQESRVTLPPIIDGICIQEPIASEEGLR